MPQKTERLLRAVGWTDVAVFLLAALQVILFAIGLKFWQNPYTNGAVAAAAALVIITAVCLGVGVLTALLSALLLGTGGCALRAAAKRNFGRRTLFFTTAGLIVSAVTFAAEFFFLCCFFSMHSGLQFFNRPVFLSFACIDVLLGAVLVALIALHAFTLVRLRAIGRGAFPEALPTEINGGKSAPLSVSSEKKGADGENDPPVSGQ